MKDELLQPPRGDLTLSGFVAAALVAVTLAAGAWWLSVQQSVAAAWVSHTHEVLATIAKTRAAVVDIQNGHRGYTITGDDRELEPYWKGREAIANETARLRTLLAGNPAQMAHLSRFQAALVPRLETAADLVAARRLGGIAAVRSILETGRPSEQMLTMRGLLQAMEQEENRLLGQRLAEQRERLNWFWTGITTLVALLLGTLVVLYLQVRRRRAAQHALRAEMRERIRIDEALQRLNRSLEAQVAERTEQLSEANAGLLDAKHRLQYLSSRLITAQEDERRHIARELHDETGQALTAIRLNLMDLDRDTDSARERIPECIGIVDRAIAQIRGMALNLRPTMLDDLGLVDALEWALGEQAKAAGWATALEADEIGMQLPPDLETACFRIAQEALTNAARHAQATRVKITLRQHGDALELTVQDNGAGFDVEQFRSPEKRRAHFGLVSMGERASLAGGQLDVEPAPGGGTVVRARFPLPAADLADGPVAAAALAWT